MRLLVVAAVGVALAGFLGTADAGASLPMVGSRSSVKSPGKKLTFEGISVRVPASWSSVVYASSSLKGPVIRIESFSPPSRVRDDDLGSATQRLIPPSGVMIDLFRYGGAAHQTAGVPISQGVQFTRADIAGFEGMRARSGAMRSFLHSGSVYTVEIAFGRSSASKAALALANAVLRTLRLPAIH
jgi:hypothetical protein